MEQPGFRDSFSFLPGWLKEGDGELLLYSLGLILDIWLARTRQGLLARFPSMASITQNDLTGRDRGLVRGRDETNTTYAERLKAWRFPRGHRTRGNAFALLQQVSEYFGAVTARTVDTKGTRYHRTEAGGESVTRNTDWVWDNNPAAQWGRFWLYIDVSNVIEEQLDFGDPNLWGGALGTPGEAIGHRGVTSFDADAVRDLVTNKHLRWRPAGTIAQWAILSMDGSYPSPDSTWVNWSRNVAGTQTKTRSDNFRYWALNEMANVYLGIPDNFCEEFPSLSGGMHVGDPASFPLTITLPSGAPYAGNPASFPASIRLVDDGDMA